MAEGEQQRLVSKRGRTNSVVWKQFGFEERDEEQKQIRLEGKLMFKEIPCYEIEGQFHYLST